MNENMDEELESALAAGVEDVLQSVEEEKGKDATVESLTPEELGDDEAPQEPDKKKKKLPVGALIGIIVAALLIVVYLGIALCMHGKYGFRTTVNGASVTWMTPEQAKTKLENTAAKWSMTVTEDGTVCGTISATDIDLKYDASEILQYPAGNSFAWPVTLFQPTVITIDPKISYNREKVQTALSNMTFAHTDPAEFSAEVKYEDGKYVTGTPTVNIIDADKLMSVVEDSITSSDTVCEITEQDVYMTENESSKTACDTLNKYLDAKITFAIGDGIVIDKTQIAGWVGVDAQMNPTINEQAIRQYLAELGKQYDGTDMVRTITTPTGKTATIQGGAYGTQIDEDNMYKTIVKAMQEGATVTAQDFGDTYCEVDRTIQHMWYVKDGSVAFEADVVTGVPIPEKETTLGLWHLNWMGTNVTLIGNTMANGQPEYVTQVAYWMGFTSTGIGFHDATWQPAFGGNLYAIGYGSHGCVNMSLNDAATLYSLVYEGIPVLVHD